MFVSCYTTANKLISMPDFVYLASQSPRRAELLTQIGVRFELLLPDADEDPESIEIAIKNEAPKLYVQRVTGLKLDAALQRLKRRGLPAAPVLCADTTVAHGRRIYAKPQDAADAKRMLTELSGKTHRVFTALAVGTARKRMAALSDNSVQFAPLSAAQIKAYVDTDDCMGKAGAYGIQGRAAAHIAHISGSYSGIMGLPVHEAALMLRAMGVKF
jgi:septum formation protein